MPPAPAQTLTPIPIQPNLLEITAITPAALQSGAIEPENLSQLIELTRIGKGGLYSLSWAPNNKYFGLGTTLGVYVYSVQPFDAKGFVPVSGGVYQFAVSPAGDKVLTSDLKVWNVDTGKELYELVLPQKSPPILRYNMLERIEFSGDGEWIYANFGEDVCTWKIEQEQSMGCRSIKIDGWDYMPWSISPNGQWAVFLGSRNNALVVNTQSRVVAHTFEYGENQVSDIVFSPDGQTIAFLSYEEFKSYPGTITIGKGRIELWQISFDGTFTLKHALEIGQGKPASSTSGNVFYSPDGQRLVVLNGNGELQFWDVRSGRLLNTVVNIGNQFALSPDGLWMLTTDRQEKAMLWKVTTGYQPQLIQSLDGFFSDASRLSISPDGSLFSSDWNNIERWDMSDPLIPRLTQQFENYSAPFSVSPDGSWLAVEAPNGMAQIVEVSSEKVLASFEAAMFSESGSTPYLTDLALSHDKQLLASVGSDWKLRLWNVSARQLQQEIDPRQFMQNLTISPDGRYLAASGIEFGDANTISHTNIAVWDISSGEMIRYFDWVGSGIAFHPNGVQIVSARGDGQISLLDLRTGEPSWVVKGSESITSLVLNPDGRLLVTANNKVIQFLDTYTGKVLGELPVTFVPCSLAFSPDGKTLAVGSRDGTIHVFSLK
ncbi:MAG: hypothetical protein QM730_21215 [Anaerolineales bacterium]